MRLRILIVIMVFLNQAGVFGQMLARAMQVKSDESSTLQEPFPEYIEQSYKSLILLEYGEALDRLKKEVPEKELAYYQAWCHFINGQLFDAFEAVSSYLRHPQSNKYYGQILLGRIEFARLNKYPSFAAFDMAILLEPTKLYAYLEKSRVYAFSQDLDEGLSFTNKCIKQFPGEAKFYIYRGLLNSKLNLPKKAIGEFNAYLNSTSRKDSADLLLVHFGLGKSYLLAKDYDNALVQTNTGLNLFPDYPPGYGLRGEILFRLKDYDSSLRDFLKMEERLKSTYYWKFIANIYEIKGDNESACSFYSKLCGLVQGGLVQDREACAKIKKLNCKTTE